MTLNPLANLDGNAWVTRAGVRFAEAHVSDHLDKCKQCRGSGLARVERPNGSAEMVACPCEITEIRRRVALYNRAQIPPRFHQAQIDRYEARNQAQLTVKQTLVRIRDSFQGSLGLGLHGPPGVGKTHLLTALAGWMTLVGGKEVIYADFSTLIAELRAGFDRGVGENRLIEPIANVQVLMIDELGKGRASEWEKGVIDRIVSHRYNAQLPTFYATNYSIPDQSVFEGEFGESLRSRLGARVWSRLQEMSTPTYLVGPDFRMRQPSQPPQATSGSPRGVQAVPSRRG